MKTKICPIRVSEKDDAVFSVKSSILGITKSSLLRSSAFQYWNGKPFDGNAEKLLQIYQKGDYNQKALIVETVFQFLRQHGYPHNVLSDEQLISGMRKISCTKTVLIDDNDLQMNTTGLEVPNSFHLHMVKIVCRDRYKSPYELFMDDADLKSAIGRWLELGKKPTLSGMRRILRTRDGVRSVVNFKPAVAKYFYDTYAPENGSVLDPCSGFSGRLAGCIASNKGLYYHGIDPQGDTASGNMRMAAHYGSLYDSMNNRDWEFGFRFDLGCAEDVMRTLTRESYDLIFTSPPFFDIEKYDTSPSQSYIRYSSYDEWKNKFLFSIIQESATLVRKNGYVIFNVKNYEKMRIADDLLAFADQVGLRLKKTYSMRLANSEYNRKKDKPTWHTEPIFVFQRLCDV